MALGRGLDALLGDTTLQAQTGGSVNLPISQVEPGLNQPRKHFDEEALADLAESIRQHGMLQPLTVRRLASGYYQIIAGERRWRAARQAGLEEVPAIIIEADDRKVMELGLIENLQREDLNPMEEAAGYRTLAFVSRTCLLQEEAADIHLFAYRGTEKEYHSMAAPAALLDALVIGVTRAMGPEGVDALKALHRWKKTYFPDR